MVAVDACCCDEAFGSGSTLLGSASSTPQLVQCVTCSGTGFNAPPWWDVTFSGILDRECTDCTTFNSTFRVEFDSGFSINRCAWTLTIPESCAVCRPIFPDVDPKGVNIIVLELFGFQSPTPPTVVVQICRLSETATGGDLLCDTSFWKIRFREVFSVRPDCLDFNNYLINDSSPDETKCPNQFPPPFGLIQACDANDTGGVAECRITPVTLP